MPLYKQVYVVEFLANLELRRPVQPYTRVHAYCTLVIFENGEADWPCVQAIARHFKNVLHGVLAAAAERHFY